MFGLKVIVGAALLAQGVFGEGVHLFNCGPFGAAGAPKTWYSIVAYCANDADCSSLGYNIPSNDACVKSVSGTSGQYHIWEGGPQSCTFPSGVTFSWNIPANAQSQADYTSVGSGSNGYRSFAGYKDNKVSGASYGGSHSCKKIYYYV
ncbi:hypothetical protein NEMBOFW57_009825 [Staphylotrichum longicolle]|uniref:Uncharacterized protein n=1 Tax=Staphylotrichum longicolle TaxID=669026 RepID=A0AAD4EQ39_9PEZI|nr:hypothetical protein NEMBOFW57_009825 [Staphylotrichum longicolle]